jgi:hypothetical protein
MGQAVRRQLLKYTLPCITLLLALISPRTYAVQPALAQTVKNPATAQISPTPRVYTQAEIDQMTAGTFHPYILRTLIKCESQNTNIARMDSNNKMSYGILQFQMSTWSQFSPLAGIPSSTPMNPVIAIKVADWMISQGLLRRWTCAKLTGLIK